MGLTATALLGSRRPGQTALDLLDTICEPYRGCDAEFEAEDPDRSGRVHPIYNNYTDPLGPLGKLIIEAFGPFPERCEAEDHDHDGQDAYWVAWYDGPHQKFKDRYGFC